MASCVSDRERAVKEVVQVYELIKVQQPLLLLHCSSLPPSSTTTQLAQSLLSEALRALNLALSVMKQQQQPSPAPATPRSVKAEPQLSSPNPGVAPDDLEAMTSTARRGKRRRTTTTTMEGKTSSWVGLTTVPYEDGYEWRKYGEKKINGTSYTRSYFRCTYKDETGCLATKHIKQKDSSDPPVFQVTYNNKHTCHNCTTKAPDSSERVINNPLINGHAASMVVKQEPPVLLLPPLVEASALPSVQTPPCQQETSFPIVGMQQQFCGTARDCHGDIPSTSSSCISGESCDEYSAGDMALMMAAAEASAADDSFCDLELLLLCDSFKDY